MAGDVGLGVVGDGLGGVGGEDGGGLAVAREDGGQREGAVEALAVELAAGFFMRLLAVANHHDGFGAGGLGAEGVRRRKSRERAANAGKTVRAKDMMV